MAVEQALLQKIYPARKQRWARPRSTFTSPSHRGAGQALTRPLGRVDPLLQFFVIDFDDVVAMLHLPVLMLVGLSHSVHAGFVDTPTRRVIDGHTGLAHHLLEITIADAVTAVPASCPQDDLVLDLASFEIRHARLCLPSGPLFPPFLISDVSGSFSIVIDCRFFA